MKNTIWILLLVMLSVFLGCNPSSKAVKDNRLAESKAAEKTNDTVRIANDELQYEVIISTVALTLGYALPQNQGIFIRRIIWNPETLPG